MVFKSYVYKLTNKITKQFYFGSRRKNVKEGRHAVDDIWIHYFSSSKKIAKLIEQHGKYSFDVEVVFEHVNFDNTFWYEQKLIMDSRTNELNLNRTYINPNTSNKILRSDLETDEEKLQRIKKMQLHKKGRFNSNGHLGLKHSKETKQRMSIIRQEMKYRHTGEDKKKMSKIVKEQRAKLSISEKKRIFGQHNLGKSWKVVDGKRVWFNKEVM